MPNGKRYRILVMVPHYLPGYKSGGPIRTISNLVDRLGDEFDFRIVTSDRDATDRDAYPSVDVDRWNQVGKAQVFYASRYAQRVDRLARLMRGTSHDLLYLNSFFHPVFTLRPLVARWLGIAPRCPTIIAPRGEFSSAALALKPWKKRAYINIVQVLRLYDNLIWQASTPHEAADIASIKGGRVKGRIRVVPNLPPALYKRTVRLIEARRRPGEPAKVLFLSRITPMKNLDFALRVMAQVSVPVHFNIYGPIRDKAYWRRCRKLMRVVPDTIKVYYNGGVPPEEVPDIIAEHDLFFLPTRGENFGNVILEALAVGTPVLITDRTPWRDLAMDGIGWDFALDREEPFVRVVEKCARSHPDEWEAQRARVVAWARERLNDRQVVQVNRRLFRDLVCAGI